MKKAITISVALILGASQVQVKAQISTQRIKPAFSIAFLKYLVAAGYPSTTIPFSAVNAIVNKSVELPGSKIEDLTTFQYKYAMMMPAIAHLRVQSLQQSHGPRLCCPA